MSDFCVNHPERPAIETCEVCGKNLCGYCLYYTEDGQRLCEQHAQAAKARGITIIPPAVYAQGIIPSQADAKRKNEEDQPKGALLKTGPTYQGNNHDLNAFVAMGIGIMMLASCCGASYCLPFAALGLGVIALMNAKDAIDPKRTRQQAWIGIATGGCFVLLILTVIGFYVFAWGSIIAISSSSTSSSNFQSIFPTSTVTPAPTRTPVPNVEPNQLTATAKASSDTSANGVADNSMDNGRPSLSTKEPFVLHFDEP